MAALSLVGRIMAKVQTASLPVRRDFLVQTASAFVAVGGVAAFWPFIDQMNPNPATPPPETRDVDLAPIQPGQAIIVTWRGKPISIRHRTPEEIRLARDTPLQDLPDPLARNDMLPANVPAADASRVKEGHEQWLVVIALCTHLGCLLKTREPGDASDESWFCPCHAARFDTSGRVRAGPARTNLPVPPYAFLSPMRIRIG